MDDLTREQFSNITISDFFSYLATDEQGAEARKVYCSEIARLLENLATWLGVDAWIGAGDTKEPDTDEPSISPERRRAFIASSLVAQMSSELIKGSVLLLREGNEYACAGLVRQLIECEYLFRAFRLDFADATKWLDAPPDEKYYFSPRNLRTIGGFDHEEYSNHCESGGHPRASGRHLLEAERAIVELERAVGQKHRTTEGEERSRDEVNLMLWADLGLHCERTWRALTALLSQEHARFDTVRREAIEEAEETHKTWLAEDMLARETGPLLAFMAADPETPLSDLINDDA